ncbi:hypothetical protein Hanom_Chr11g01018221 [Helianthus anomalus]
MVVMGVGFAGESTLNVGLQREVSGHGVDEGGYEWSWCVCDRNNGSGSRLLLWPPDCQSRGRDKMMLGVCNRTREA